MSLNHSYWDTFLDLNQNNPHSKLTIVSIADKDRLVRVNEVTEKAILDFHDKVMIFRPQLVSMGKFGLQLDATLISNHKLRKEHIKNVFMVESDNNNEVIMLDINSGMAARFIIHSYLTTPKYDPKLDRYC